MKPMKTLLTSLGFTVTVLCAVVVLVLVLVRDWNQAATGARQVPPTAADVPAPELSPAEEAPPSRAARSSQRSAFVRAEGAAPLRPSISPAALKSATASTIHPRFESLLDSQTSFDEKQSILQQMAQSGKLDAAIGELEQRARDQGPDPVVLATLGRTYLEKSGTLQDVREQGVLGLKADQVLEQALAADSQNWDARYWKAFAMSFWPPQLGKTSEVMESLLTLVQLQETATPRPEFARSYVLLGEQYQRSGHDDYARQVWQRGMTMFPDNTTLNERLANLQ
jgi:tetratricopeptide (TPR) repeat protein